MNFILVQICMLPYADKIEEKAHEDLIPNIQGSIAASFFTLITIFTCAYMLFSSKQKARIFSIPKRRRNLLTMSQHCGITLLHCLNNFSIQWCNVIRLESETEKEVRNMVFKVWWFQQFAHLFVNNILIKIWILYEANSELEHFNGLVGAPLLKRNHSPPFTIEPRRDFEINGNFKSSTKSDSNMKEEFEEMRKNHTKRNFEVKNFLLPKAEI